MNGIESAKRKVERAEEHLQALPFKAAAYSTDRSNFVVEEGNGEHKLRFVNQPPLEITILAGEIVYQLRSALNHLAFELVKSNASNAALEKGWDRDCEFPLLLNIPTIGDSRVPRTKEQIFELFRKKRLPGLTKKAFVVIEPLQPYNGGNGPTQLGWLAKLANVDKHRHFHIVSQQAYQTEWVKSPRIDSQTLLRLQDGAKIPATLHSADELADAVQVERTIDYPFISFEESALPADVTDVPLDNVLELCVSAIERLVIPA